tara:strand:+ start:234 stop:1514 length:1281 start_codon:yes stop_codon:yes gene_type:complete
MKLNLLIKKIFLSTLTKFISSLGVIFFNIIIIFSSDKNTLGIITSAISLIVFLSIFAKFGLNLATLKLTSIFYENKDSKNINQSILQSIIISGITSIIIVLILIFFEKEIVMKIYKNPQISGVLKIFAISLPFFTFLQLQKSLFKSFKKPELSSLSDVGSILFLISILIIFFQIIEINLTVYRISIFFLFSCITIFSLNNFILFYLILKDSSIFKLKKFYYKKNELLKSLPDYFSIDLVNYLNVWGCIFLSSFFYESSVVGSFTSVYWFAYSILFFPLVINSIYAPYYAIDSKKNNLIRLKKLFYQNRNTSLILTLPIFLVLFIFSNFFLKLILNIDSTQLDIIFKILLINSLIRILFGPQNLFLNMASEEKKLKHALIISTIFQTLSMMLSLIYLDIIFLTVTFLISNILKHIWLRIILNNKLSN